MKQALIIVDVQKEYFPGGKLALYEPEKALEQIQKVLRLFREKEWPVFFIRHISLSREASVFIPGTIGVELHPALIPYEDEIILDKHFPSSFLGTGLHDHLTALKIERLVVCGMMTHMCIDTTVRAAQNDSLPVTLLEDACTGPALEWEGMHIPYPTVHAVMMASLSGTFATVEKADLFLREHP
jgi:nicotinamidase-related amidase